MPAATALPGSAPTGDASSASAGDEPDGAHRDLSLVEEPDDTTTRLVTAAAQVFAEKGYEGAGVAEIARRAGLTTGAIYNRFSGKAELLLAAIRASTGDELDTLFASHAFDGRAPDVLRTVGMHLVTRRPEPGRGLLLEAFVAARHHPEVAHLVRDHLAQRAARMAALVDDSKAHALVDPVLDTDAIVQFAHAVGLGFLLFEAVGAPNADPAEWETLIDRVISSVASPANPSVPPDTPIPPTTQE